MVSDIVKRFRGLSFLIISLFIIFGMLVSFSLYAIWPVVTDESEKSVFDKRFESGEIKIDANLFLAGESGHPALSDISKIPRTGIYDEINLKPRRFWAGGGCVDIKAPVKFEGVYAATNYSNPETAYTNSPLFYV